MRTKLSVNINKVALIRNARGGNLPDLVQFAVDCEDFGAEGITVHPRPDERHVRFSDLHSLKDVVTTEFNVEGYPSSRFMVQVLELVPHQCTLVPDPPGVLTSNTGWDTSENKTFLKEVVQKLKAKGIRVSLFLNPDLEMLRHASETGADRVELYTGGYARNFHDNRERAIEKHIAVSKQVKQFGLGLNAGHDLNLDNLNYYVNNVSNLEEVSIGHALITDALYYGISNTIQMYLHEINK